VSRTGVVSFRLACPFRWSNKLTRGCRGVARMVGARRSKRYTIRAGWRKTVKLRLTARRLRTLKRTKTMTLRVAAINQGAKHGTVVRIPVEIKRPVVKKAKKRRR
jgi:hypothetical protein